MPRNGTGAIPSATAPMADGGISSDDRLWSDICSAYDDVGRSHLGLDLADREISEVKDAGREDGVGAAQHGGHEILQRARSPARYHWHVDACPNEPDPLEVVAVLRAVGVHR